LLSRRASFAAFKAAFRQARTFEAENRKPFSQRFIKALILSSRTGAILPVGPVSDAVSETLANYFGDAFRYMQDATVRVLGRRVPLPHYYRDSHPDGTTGFFRHADDNGEVLEQPEICIDAAQSLLDPRGIFHEMQHIRQYLVCEESVRDFREKERYVEEGCEIKAKLAEAEMVKVFGILF
jgi:hypothetical protein